MKGELMVDGGWLVAVALSAVFARGCSTTEMKEKMENSEALLERSDLRVPLF